MSKFGMFVCVSREWFYGKNANRLLTPSTLERWFPPYMSLEGLQGDRLKNFTYVSSWLNEDSFISTPEKAKRQEMVAREQLV